MRIKNDPKNWPSASKERRVEYQRQYRARHPERMSAKHHKDNLKKKFGMVPEQYEAILDVQDGVCAICGGVDPNGKRLAVDHCHETGVIRGLLCTKCNWSLAAFDHDDLLLKASAYLAVFWARDEDVPEEQLCQ